MNTYIHWIAVIQLYIYTISANSFDLGSYLTRNSSKIWFKKATNGSSDNEYCTICCINIKKNTVGKHCGKHTMCIYNNDTVGPACKGYVNIQFTDEEKEALVDAHNTIRNNVAMGLESRGNPGPQPKAANMRALLWDLELEALAKRWAQQCVFARDTCRDVGRFPVGQNIAKGNYALTNDLSFIAGWYENVDFYNHEDVLNYQLDPTDSLSLYTQLVWAETYQMGCARIAFQSPNGSSVFYKEHFICDYGPTGNIPGQSVYRVGEPCSACAEGTACTVEYPGLCGSETVFAISFKKPQKREKEIVESTDKSGKQHALNLLCTMSLWILYCTRI